MDEKRCIIHQSVSVKLFDKQLVLGIVLTALQILLISSRLPPSRDREHQLPSGEQVQPERGLHGDDSKLALLHLAALPTLPGIFYGL